jgi:hypothetical protein
VHCVGQTWTTQCTNFYEERECPTLINICYKHQGIQIDDKCHDKLGMLMEVIIRYINTTNNY